MRNSNIAENISFLPGKLQPPHLRVSLIGRPQLIEKLEQGQAGRLTLIHGPAGFGKTTLLSQWHAFLKAKCDAVAWLTFDEDDNNPALILAYLAEALRQAVPALSTLTFSTQHRASPSAIREGLARILTIVKDNRPVTLILDDYHFLPNRDGHDLVMQLIKAAPENLHIIIATRLRHLLPISSLAMHGLVQEITPEDLRINNAELPSMLGNSIEPTTQRMLLERTEGWPIAMQLARNWSENKHAAATRFEDFSGSSGSFALYLTEQIMADLPEPIQHFLIENSIVDYINGDLADTICDRCDSWQVLHSLERLSALIIPIDEERSWYRYHHLFAEYLRSRQKMLGEKNIRQLHERAASWYLDHAQLDKAVKHLSLAGNYEAAAETIEDYGGVWITVYGGTPKLKRLLENIPSTLIDERLRLRTARALLWMKDGLLLESNREINEIRNLVAMSPCLDKNLEKDILMVGAAITGQGDDGVSIEVVNALESMAGSTLSYDKKMQGVLQQMLCLIYLRRGNVLMAAEAGRISLQAFNNSKAENGLVFCHLHLSVVSIALGNLDHALEHLTIAEAIALDCVPNDLVVLVMVRVMLAYCHYERNDLRKAEDLCYPALSESENREGWLEIYLAGYYVSSGIYMARGDLIGALNVLRNGDANAERRDLKRLKTVIDYRRIEIRTLSQPTEALRLDLDELLKTFYHSEKDKNLLEREVAAITLARLAILHNKPDIALDLLSTTKTLAEQNGRGRSLIKIYLLQAMAHHKCNNLELSADYALKALELAVPQRWRRLFMEEEPPLAKFLNDILPIIRLRSLDVTTITFLAEIFSIQVDPAGLHDGKPAQILKPREREVLQGLDNGLSNKVIARQLNITDDAIKYHLKKIYAKLGVNDRNMAVAVARNIGILI